MFQNKTNALLILGLIIVAATFLRVYHIDYQSLSVDELHSVDLTNPNNKLVTINEVSENFGSQTFYTLLFYVFKFFGYEAIVGRLIFAIIGILAVPIFYFLGKEFGGSKVGLFSSLLTALNYFHITYSQELNFYSMAFLFSASSYLFFIRSYKYGRDLDFIIYSLLTIFLLRTHSYGFVVLLSQIVTAFIMYKFYDAKWRFVNGFVFSAIGILLIAPWSQALVNDLVIGYDWMQKPNLYFILGYVYNYFGKDILVSLICLLLIGFSFRHFIRKESSEQQMRPLYMILILWLAVPYIFLFVKSLVGNSIIDIRFTISFLPIWFILAAIGWNKIPSNKFKLGIATCIILSSLVNLIFITKYYTRIQKEQVREIVQIVKLKNTADHLICSESPTLLNFYFNEGHEQITHLDTLYQDSLGLQTINKFWLIHIGAFNTNDLTKLTKQFKIVDRHSLYKADAFYMERR